MLDQETENGIARRLLCGMAYRKTVDLSGQQTPAGTDSPLIHDKTILQSWLFSEKDSLQKKEHSLRNCFATGTLHLSLPPFHCLQS